MSTLVEHRREAQLRVRSYEGQTRTALVKQVGSLDVGQTATNTSMSVTRQGRVDEFYTMLRDWVYTATNAIAKRLAGQPWMAGEIEHAPDNPERSARMRVKQAWLRGKLPQHVLQKSVLDQQLNVFAQHEVLDVLCEPNPVQGKSEFIYMSAMNLLVTGEAYWMAGVVDNPDGDGKQLEAWAVPTRFIRPVHDPEPFSSYMLLLGGAEIPIPGENIARTYYPDPSDMYAALSPMAPVIQAIRTDIAIQRSNYEMFRRGITPNVIVTIGREMGPDGRLTDSRPVLTGPQRRQMIRMFRELVSSAVNEHDPLIIDGMIDSVHKLQNTAQEMDWQKSGETVKDRILMAYNVNPLALGQTQGGNRAQATEAKKSFAENAVNPLGDAFSQTATRFFGPMFERPQRLLVWIEAVEPRDPELDIKRWEVARRNNDASQDEFRAEQLGLPPREDLEDTARLLNQVGGFATITNLLIQVRSGVVSRESAIALLIATCRISEETAERIVGDEEPIEDEPVEAPTSAPELVVPDEDIEELPEAAAKKSVAGDRLDREMLKAMVREAFVKSTSEVERRLTRTFVEFHHRQVLKAVSHIRQANWKPIVESAESQSEKLMKQAFDAKAFEKELRKIAFPLLTEVMWEAAKRQMVIGRKQLSSRDVPVVQTEAPQWFVDVADDVLQSTFEQDYWQDVGPNIRTDIQRSLLEGIESGQSVNEIADGILSNRGEKWSRQWAERIAATESINMANAGHVAAIEELGSASGEAVSKEWLNTGDNIRDHHAEANGQVVAADANFQVGGEEAPWPGHFSLRADNRINCKCTVILAAANEG